jgi:integrase
MSMSVLPDAAVRDLCQAARQDLAAIGAAPAITVIDSIERLAGSRDRAALTDPVFALELLMAEADAALVATVLEFLRARADAPVATPTSTTTLADAIEEYRHGAFRSLSENTRRTYGTWLARLSAAIGDRRPQHVTTGDLVDLIQEHAPRRLSEGRVRRVEGVGAARTAATAYRHLWIYLDSKGYADAAVAVAVSKPSRSSSTCRRAYRPPEAALVRELASAGPDPMLDAFVVLMAERALLRRGEICRLRLCDLDFDEALFDVWGKGDRSDVVPMTPGLTTFLRDFVEDRRPPHVAPDAWRRSTELLLRRRPSSGFPDGRPLTRRYIENMLARFHRLAPELFNDGGLCLHTFRHTGATWLERAWGRSVAQAALRHRPNTPSAHYFPVPTDRLREALTEYEASVLSCPMP